MRQGRRWIAALLAAVLLLGTAPATAVESEEPRPEELAETLPENPAEEPVENLPENPAEEPAENPAEEPPVENPAKPPEEEPAAELPEEAGEEPLGVSEDGDTGDSSAVTVTTSAQFRAALKNNTVETVCFEGHITIETLSTDEENHLVAEKKTILPTGGDYGANSLSFAPGVTLLQISSHAGNRAQDVADQSISRIYGTKTYKDESGDTLENPDLLHLAELVPGTVGWYEYHADEEGGSTDPYAGMRVCYTMYFGSEAEAVDKAAELTAGHQDFTATETGDDYRLVFMVLGKGVTLSKNHYLEVDTLCLIPHGDDGNEQSLTIETGGSLRVNREMETWCDVTVAAGGQLDLSDKKITSTAPDAPEGPVSFLVGGNLIVDPAGDIAFGSADSWAGGDVILGKRIPQPGNLTCDGAYVPCLAINWDGENYGTGHEMLPGDEDEMTFSLCQYLGGDPGIRDSYKYTDLTEDELASLSIRRVEPAPAEGESCTLWYGQLESHENRWTLTAQDANLGDQYEITYEISNTEQTESYSLPIRIKYPDLCCYRTEELTPEGRLGEWPFSPLSANTFYVLANPDAWWYQTDSNWNLPEMPEVHVWRDGQEAETDPAGLVSCEAVTGADGGTLPGVWRVTVSDFGLHVVFAMRLVWAGSEEDTPDAADFPVIETDIQIVPAEQLVYSETVLTDGDALNPDDPQDPDDPSRTLTEANRALLKDRLELTANTSADVVLYQLVYQQREDPAESRWTCEYVHPAWAEGLDGLHLSAAPEDDRYTRVTAEGGQGEARIFRVHGNEDDQPDYGNYRGEPLPVAVSEPDAAAPRLMVWWGGENYSEEITMTPRDAYEVTFVLRELKGDGTDADSFQYTELDPEKLVFPDPLRYEPMETHGNRRTLTAEGTELGQRYAVTYAAGDGGTYSLPVRIELPELGCYREPEARPEYYLPDWQFDPLVDGPNEFYVCVNPDAWFQYDENWELPGTITARGVRYGENGQQAVVEGSVSCTPVLDESGERIPGVWKAAVTAPQLNAEFTMQLVRPGAEQTEEDPDAPVIGAGCWVEAGQWLVCSDEPLAGASPYPGDPENPDRLLTDDGKGLLHGKLELEVNTARDVVLYLLVYDQEGRRWICEHTAANWAEGRDGVYLTEAEAPRFTRVTASWPGEGAQPVIVRLDGEEISENTWQPLPGSTRGNPLPVVVTGEPDAPRLMARWPGGDYSGELAMTPLDEHEVVFVLHSDAAGTEDTVLDRNSLDLGPLDYVDREERNERGEVTKAWQALTAERADWNRTWAVTYTAGGRTYTLPVRVEQPDLGCYSAPEPLRENLIRTLEYSPLAEANEFYVCVNPNAGFTREEGGKWEIPETLTVRAWQDSSPDTDLSRYVRLEQMGEGVWRAAVTKAALHVDLELQLTWTGTGEAPEEGLRGAGCWIDPRERLVFSGGVLAGKPLDPQNPDHPNRVLDEENRSRLQERLTLNPGARRDAALYLLVYDEGQDQWNCEYTSPEWVRAEGVTLDAVPDSLLLRVTAPAGSADARLVRLDGEKTGEDSYQPIQDSARGLPLAVSVSGSVPLTAMEAADGQESVMYRREDRQITVSGPLSAASPLYAAGYDAEGRLVSVAALTGNGSVRLPEDAAWYQLIWTDGSSAPRCRNVYEYLGVN